MIIGTMEDNFAITEVRKGSFCDRIEALWYISTITDDDALDELERMTGLKIALAMEYIRPTNVVDAIAIVTTDRKHYKIYF